MIPLPIDPFLPEILARVRESRSLVLVAEPGAGKTTRVPPALLRDAKLLSNQHPNIVMLQPRRVAARAAAMRIADENGWTVGKEVGYHVRFDRKLTRDTRLRWMQSVIGCTHYVHGAGELQYLNEADAPEVTFVPRMDISDPDKAYVGTNG